MPMKPDMQLNTTSAVMCRNCALYQTARVLGLETPDCSSLNRIVLRNHPVSKNEVLYAEGEPFRYLYLIHSGSCISRCQPWRAKRRLVVPSSREAALFSRRALRQRENKVGLRTWRPVIGSQVRSSNELAKLLRSAW